MKITVIGGTGYVGLTTAVCLASKGHLVFCVGRSKEKIKKISMGLPTIYEENLESILKDVLERNKFIPTTDLRNAVQSSDISFICVGTPGKSDGRIDLKEIKNAAKEIDR